ncbi:uncharacterized protein C8R40DRAFT_639107 [Lentinula edodes]|uniref:uncharacterized protein n=1 Tax=Lentinula edodes TaxID=5353 RepID=UPI001E8E402A|nr:uncharacterized protein C8R40DRAFT_639107 [Lentinula edodes]KAH7870481.1 hypothetical protein C8R40DRAFT_639107 [Lentinula edodes]
MRPLLIDKKEWKLLEDLADILEPFTHVTLIMSRTSQPTIPFVLPAYHQLDTHLEAKSTETSLPKILTNAASVGLEKLRKYKRLADGNRFYVLGTVLHPGMRSKWFETLGTTSWEREDHRDKAETMFRHVALDYFQEQLTSPTPDQSSLNKPKPPANGFLSQMCAVDLSFIPTSPRATQADLEDEISRYLRFEGGVGKTQEPLEWWQVRSIMPLHFRF